MALLVERGARHHIFSAMCVGDLDLIQELVEQNPDALDRRLSRFERGQTPLHFAISRKRYDILDLLIELGADLEAKDMSGQTALDVCDAARRSRGDAPAARGRGEAADVDRPVELQARAWPRWLTPSRKGVPMILVPDVARALDWYTSIGFKELARYGDDGLVNFGMVSFGKAELMLNMHGKPARTT